MPTLDVRSISPVDRHPHIHQTFEEMESGETLTLINDHEPKPLYYEMAAEVPEFDEQNYSVEQIGPSEFVASFPKRSVNYHVSRTSITKLDGEPHAVAFPGMTPKTIRLTLSAGESVPPHSHPGKEILFFLIDGTLELSVDQQSYSLASGDLIRFDGTSTVEPFATEDTTALIVLSPEDSDE